VSEQDFEQSLAQVDLVTQDLFCFLRGRHGYLVLLPEFDIPGRR
jgi:hypothetical protein